jgi:hypothetical protein
MGKIVVRNSAQNLTVLDEIELRRVQDLAPHPESRRIPDMAPGEWKSFLEDVKKRGIVEPIEITDKNEILDGRHRWKAAKELGIEKIPVRVVSPPDPIEYILSAAIERRHLTEGQKAALVLEREEYLQSLKKEADERKKASLKQYKNDQKCSSVSAPGHSRKGKTFEHAGKAVGVSARTLYRVQTVKRASPELFEKVKKGEIAPKKAYSIVSSSQKRTQLEQNPDSDGAIMAKFGYSPKPFDVWSVRTDERFGKERPGRIPAEIVFQTLYFFTKQGDLIVDPMAGGGVTGDVCKVMNRRCLMYDISPSREDIKKHDIRDGFPLEGAGAELVFLDPPYYKKLEKEYGLESISSLPRAEYLAVFRKFARDAVESGVKKVALLMSDYTDETNPQENIFIWHYVREFEEAGWIPIRHIMVPLSTQQVHPDIVNKFVASRRLARLSRSLVVFVRGSS